MLDWKGLKHCKECFLEANSLGKRFITSFAEIYSQTNLAYDWAIM